MNNSETRRRSRCLKSALLLGLALPACSGSGSLMLGELFPAEDSGLGAGGGSGGGNSASGGGGGGGGSSSWIETDASLFDVSIGDASVCSAPTILDPLAPVLYLVVDRSDDMQDSQQQNGRWPDLVEGLTGYLASNAASQLSVGLGYYPNPCQLRQPPQTCAGMGTQNCLPSSYFDANVPIGAPSAVSNSLIMLMGPIGPNGLNNPSGPTAMRVALDGALQAYIPDWERANRSQFVVPVVIAGGPPQGMDCSPNNPDAVAAVADYTLRDGGTNSHTRTFVIAFEIDNPNNTQSFDLIAQHGGTNRAYVLDGRPSATQELTNSIEDIRRRSCMFQLPANAGEHYSFDILTVLNPTHGDVVYAVAERAPDSLGLGSACGRAQRDFEMYTDPSDNQRLIGCDRLCQEIAAGGTVRYLPECQTNPTAPPR
jgi:hypothetical protein